METELEKVCDREKEILAIHALLVYAAECAKEIKEDRLIEPLRIAMRATKQCLKQH